MGLWALMQEVQEAVQALDLRCIISPNDLNPPCVLVGAPNEVVPQSALGGGMGCTIPLEVIARGLTVKDLQWLCDAVDTIMEALPGVTAAPVIYRLSDGRELPSYTITLEGNT